ncbi:MAG: hypothetical protein KQH53_14435 [Desulfarculaceae bacterium]|nr:hypothetical protein [Desulfarculaceae bacterium]
MKQLLVAILALVLAACLRPRAGLAACVYNRAHSPIYVVFDCGPGCSNNWTIHPTYHKCLPGKPGVVAVRVMDAANRGEIGDGVCVVKVGAHGWVTVYQDGKKVTVKSKHKDSALREECSTTIVRD